ncbi:MAG: hypothetical protein OHK0038_08970 [Flammeovirgaceae bacterium]
MGIKTGVQNFIFYARISENSFKVSIGKRVNPKVKNLIISILLKNKGIRDIAHLNAKSRCFFTPAFFHFFD